MAKTQSKKQAKSVDILVPSVNISLLRKQRNTLLEIAVGEKAQVHVDGVINLLDAMLDIAEVGRVL